MGSVRLRASNMSEIFSISTIVDRGMLVAKNGVIRVLVQTPTREMIDHWIGYPVPDGVCTKSLATT